MPLPNREVGLTGNDNNKKFMVEISVSEAVALLHELSHAYVNYEHQKLVFDFIVRLRSKVNEAAT